MRIKQILTIEDVDKIAQEVFIENRTTYEQDRAMATFYDKLRKKLINKKIYISNNEECEP